MAPSSPVPIPEAFSKLQSQFRESLSSSRLRAELMIVLLRSIDHICTQKQLTFDIEESLAASNGNQSEKDGSNSKPLIDYGQSHESSADLSRRDRIACELEEPEIRDIRQATTKSLSSWRFLVLTKFGQLLDAKSSEVMRLNASYNPSEVVWKCTTSLPGGFKPIPSQLVSLDEKARKDIIGIALNVFMLVLVQYNAYARLLMQHLTACLDLPPSVLLSSESDLARVLLCDPEELKSKADEVTKSQQQNSSFQRKWKIGAATIAGAAVIGLTGGIAAPFLIGSVASLLGGLGLGGVVIGLGALGAGNPLVIAGIFGALGGRMSRKAMDEFTKEVNDFRLIPLHQSSNKEKAGLKDTLHKERLRVVVGVTGWIEDPKSLVAPWSIFSPNSIEVFALRYEYAALYRLGTTLSSILRDSAFSLAQASVLQLTIPAIMAAGLLPFGLIQMGGFLDNPFRIAMTRSDKAGKVLAKALIEKAYGARPVTLVGFSLGARVIYSCLLELADQSALGLIENVALIGAPTPSDSLHWRKIRAVVTGRVVNAYSTDDLLLAFLYRASHAQIGIAGLAPIEHIPGVENVDVTDVIHGHRQYLFATGAVLERVGFPDLDAQAVESQKQTLVAVNEYEKDVHEKARKEGKLKDIEDEHGNLVLQKERQAASRKTRPRIGGTFQEELWNSNDGSSRDPIERNFSFYSEPEMRGEMPKLIQRPDGHRYLVYGDQELDIDRHESPLPGYPTRDAEPSKISTTATAKSASDSKILLKSSNDELQADRIPTSFSDMHISETGGAGGKSQTSPDSRPPVAIAQDEDLAPKEFDDVKVWKIEMEDNESGEDERD